MLACGSGCRVGEKRRVTGLAPVLDVRDVEVHFAPRRGWFGGPRPVVKAVDGVDFTIGAGETLGLVGESGCGKSTLSNAIVGLVHLTRGSIRVRGQEIAGATRKTLHAVRRDVQMVFQDPALSLNPRATIGTAIAEPLIVRGIAKGRALAQRVDTLLAQVGLRAEHAGRYPHQFSGGQRQRIVIARALALEPALVVCDEPVSALDVSVRAQILNLLVDLQRRMGVSYLFVSHDLSVVRHISDQVAVMYLGRIVEQACRDVFFAAPKHPYTRALISAVPEANPVAQRAKRRLVPSGELPSPTDVPPGCPFHTRCPLATEICTRERPLLTPRPDGTRVACHHA
jgi:oligopeptide transport system ATP-binding protein